MKKYVFHLQKTVSWTPRFRLATKRLEVEAADSLNAFDKIASYLQDRWEVSMFWPEWP
jgi:hypothetical protein